MRDQADERGIHHLDEAVSRRCFYLFSRLVKECKSELEMEMVPPILDSMEVRWSSRSG